jgi:F-type H+-transporting ATPase subunit b
MYHFVIAAATTEKAEHSAGLFQALGVNVTLLVENAIAFLILLALLGKFVYPALMRAVDARREAIEAGLKEAKESQEAAEKAQVKVTETLEAARKDADEIVARSHQEASLLVAEAEEKAKTRAEQIVADARQQLDNDVRKARETLKRDTVELVAIATERVIGEKLDDKKDAALVKKALSEERA